MTLHFIPMPEEELRPLTIGFVPIAEPVRSVTRQAETWHRVRDTAPLAPHWFSMALSKVLVSSMSADALLIVADALDEAARAAETEGRAELGNQLARLADLPREAASRRAGGPLKTGED